MRGRSILALAVAVLVTAGVAIAVIALDAGEGRSGAPARVIEPRQCRRLADDQARACYAQVFEAMLDPRSDPRPVVGTISDMAWSEGGFLLANCHGVMHSVGRAYARDAGLTLATLMRYLPRTNDPGCSAGFAHGLVTAVAPDIDPAHPREAAAVCADAGTRYQRYSCTHGFGHAFMRIYADRLGPALGLCRALGPRFAADCAQGAYHDYWFAAVGVDDAKLPEGAVTDPRRLCRAQPRPFVRPCWYRAYIDDRPEGVEIRSAEDLDALCRDVRGLQREACITAASVIGPPDPVEQLQVCAGLADPSDATNCVRGLKVQNLLGYPTAAYVDLIDRCPVFLGPPREACFRWLGKALAVLTDGRFARVGCPRVESASGRRACFAGARSMEGPLVTFS